MFFRLPRAKPSSFCLFSSFSQYNDKYCTKFDYKWKNEQKEARLGPLKSALPMEFAFATNNKSTNG